MNWITVYCLASMVLTMLGIALAGAIYLFCYWAYFTFRGSDE